MSETTESARDKAEPTLLISRLKKINDQRNQEAVLHATS